ncbi:Alpha/beta hydrolase of unknown function [Sinosporangium album]|uniref:Alpha/beta hydrolase n=1 Tax=Sinosporangium album TaxID=504805 RepID=A0A1G7YDL8_9ACTN|nr:alpha/beta hydrolase [Sinosporangium album]SDG94494.1 Alpha/beta hydrolase of unknown function [Sinosporangium album]
MNDVEELARFAVVHARNQGVSDTALERVLSRIGHDREGEAGSWAVEWTAAGDDAAAAGDDAAAVALYTLARFPYPDGPARRSAQRRAVEAFTRWSAPTPIEPLTFFTAGRTARAWTVGLSAEAERPRPLVLVIGGIVAPKEQYAPVLLQLDRLGLAGVVAEIPGVGENTALYGRESWRFIPALIDAVGDRADVSRTYAVAMSFSGHLALRAAVHDPRIRGVVTAGAPVRWFFTDREWQRRLPSVTVHTLAHLLRCSAAEVGEVGDVVARFGLSDEELGALAVPVRCIVSLRDEIVPARDVELLRLRVRDLDTLVHDDVHGSPGHVAESRLWSVLSVVRMLGGPDEVLTRLESALDATRV